MDQWNLRAHINQYSQQQSGQGASAQYSYNSSTYSQQPQQQQQQQAPSSGSAAYNPQAYLQQNVGSYGGGATYGWSQRPQTQQPDQTQAAYGGNRVSAQVPSGGAASGNQYQGQYGGVYGVPQQQQQQQQQLLGVAKASDYQASGGAPSRSSGAYGGGGVQDRQVASGASYVAGGGVSSMSVYGGGAAAAATDSSKYLPTAGGYVSKGVDYGAAANQYNTTAPKVSSGMADHQYYPGVKPPDNYASQVYEQLQQQVARVAAASGTTTDMSGRATVLGNAGYGAPDASGLLASLGGAAGGLPMGSHHQQHQHPHQPGSYGGAGNRGMSAHQVYPGSPTLGYGGVSLPPGRDYGTGRVSGGSMFQREGSYGRDRPSIGSSRFDDRERERSERERKREERDREREREQREIERRERERERRDEERRRERNTPPAPRARRDLSPVVARRDEKSRRESSPRREMRHASPSLKEKRRDYVCKIDPANVIEFQRDYVSINRRYPRLTIAPEFSKYILSWMGMEDNISLEKPISFEHDSIDVEEDHPEPREHSIKSSDKQKPSVVWNVKVMLMSGLTEECVGELLSDKPPEKPINFHKFLKFVALRRDRNAIMAAGARWDKSLDGGDPSVDDNALVRTAIRSLKELVQLDLSECKTWIRFGEVHYDRVDSDGLPSYKEISVIFLPDISGCVPSQENWCLQWNQRKQAKVDRETFEKKEATPSDKDQEKESANGVVEKSEEPVVKEEKEKEDKKEKEEPVPEPGFILMTKRSKSTKLRSMTISLDGLLDYDESDKDECTFELSLFAEAFAEMLQFRKGNQILSSLEALRKASLLRRKEEKKRARQTEPGKENETKRVKSEGTKATPADETPKPTSSEPVESPEENKIVKEAIEAEVKPSSTPTSETEPDEKDEEKKKEKNNNKKEKEKKEKIVVVDKELLKAYRYFDKNKAGYIKGDDVKKLLHSLGKFMSSKHVKDLISCAVLESGKRDEKIMYRSITDKEVNQS